jgi:hypothetical protein
VPGSARVEADHRGVLRAGRGGMDDSMKNMKHESLRPAGVSALEPFWP